MPTPTDILILTYEWEKVVQASYNKYPNPVSQQVVMANPIRRHLVVKSENPNSPVLTSENLIFYKTNISKHIQNLFGIEQSYAVSHEKSKLDIDKRVLKLSTTNDLIAVNETMCYSIHPDHEEKTLVKQNISIKLLTLAFQNIVEPMVLQLYKKGVNEGRSAIEWVISSLDKQLNVINMH
ncbi:MAG: phosphatidic acid transporter activity [Paramarteilia canceri]